jgi:light-regulated signal transduction histidine kinase (bacteriophytochrome)
MAAYAGAAWIETWHPLASSPWVLVVRPRDTAAAVPSLLPTIFLVTGLIASGTIGALFWSVRLARRRSRTLVDTNLAIGQILDEARAELHVTRDDRTSIETEIRQRTDELRDAVAELDALNASVSHDLRSPIGAIVNFTSLVRATQGDRLDEEGQTFLRRIESSAVRALGRMDGLLLYSRVGRQPLRRERLEMTSVARRVLQDARRLSAVRWETTLQPLPDVDADPHLTELLLRQLVDNAMKFAAAAAKPQIEIGAVRSDGEGPVVYFVRDNGAGFAGEGSRLFGLFERGHASGEFEGAGLGLAIARRIVGRHLGRIWAEGSPGQGATFSFVLEAEHDGRRAGERSGAAAG